ncbi:hypothetical protein Pmani_030979 [Petrolisthes manimaculis]|uniref:IRF tryptophan pentad repeat domain-containing protein n=1 Tax=Petrolisthes manimaculis TaxID=1843537 RepID=A0AAE1NUJ1_9EUCA|nr:hypothetical protein Pmani_030979 [Petrolisthes manimaculis]
MSRATVKPCVGRFLVECLEEESLRHLLQWEDKEAGTFRLLWLHAGRANFDKHYHQELFHRYREYKGLSLGDDAKQSFSMALKKSPAVEVLARLPEDDWRYYRFNQRAKCRLSLHHTVESSSLSSSEWQSQSSPACSPPSLHHLAPMTPNSPSLVSPAAYSPPSPHQVTPSFTHPHHARLQSNGVEYTEEEFNPCLPESSPTFKNTSGGQYTCCHYYHYHHHHPQQQHYHHPQHNYLQQQQQHEYHTCPVTVTGCYVSVSPNLHYDSSPEFTPHASVVQTPSLASVEVQSIPSTVSELSPPSDVLLRVEPSRSVSWAAGNEVSVLQNAAMDCSGICDKFSMGRVTKKLQNSQRCSSNERQQDHLDPLLSFDLALLEFGPQGSLWPASDHGTPIFNPQQQQQQHYQQQQQQHHHQQQKQQLQKQKHCNRSHPTDLLRSQQCSQVIPSTLTSNPRTTSIPHNFEHNQKTISFSGNPPTRLTASGPHNLPASQPHPVHPTHYEYYPRRPQYEGHRCPPFVKEFVGSTVTYVYTKKSRLNATPTQQQSDDCGAYSEEFSIYLQGWEKEP